MARGKVQMKRVENPVHRQVTFCKRRTGLLKKAKELSVLCDADIGVIIFNSHGKLYELSTKGNMQGLIERYMKSTKGAEVSDGENNQSSGPVEEITSLQTEITSSQTEIQLLQKGLRYMFEGGAGGGMSMDELNLLEKHLEIWINHVRSTKMKIMFQEIQLLKNKEGILKAANEYLQGKIEEQYGAFDVAPPLITGIPYQLTIANEIFQF